MWITSQYTGLSATSKYIIKTHTAVAIATIGIIFILVVIVIVHPLILAKLGMVLFSNIATIPVQL